MRIHPKKVITGDKHTFGFGGFWGRLGVQDNFLVGFVSLLNCDEHLMTLWFYALWNHLWIALIELESFGTVKDSLMNAFLWIKPLVVYLKYKNITWVEVVNHFSINTYFNTCIFYLHDYLTYQHPKAVQKSRCSRLLTRISYPYKKIWVILCEPLHLITLPVPLCPEWPASRFGPVVSYPSAPFSGPAWWDSCWRRNKWSDPPPRCPGPPPPHRLPPGCCSAPHGTSSSPGYNSQLHN